MRFLLLLFLFAFHTNAKIVYVQIYMNWQEEPIKTSYTVNPNIPVWRLKDMVFGAARTIENYGIVKKTKDAFVRLHPENLLGTYGDGQESPVLFYIIPLDR